MLFKKFVDVEAEVEVEISCRELIDELLSMSNPDGLMEALRLLNTCGSILKSVPDSSIDLMNESQRRIISDFLRVEVNRYAGIPQPIKPSGPSEPPRPLLHNPVA